MPTPREETLDNGPAAVAVTHYKGNAGDGAFEFRGLPAWPPGFYTYQTPQYCYAGTDCFGIMWRTSYFRGGVNLKEVTDGTSNTILVGETSPEDGNSPAWSCDGDWAITGVPLNWNWKTDRACLDATGNPVPGNHPCWRHMRGFRSLHVGGVNFAFADGNVRYLSENINHPVYRALSTRASDDLVTEF